MAGKSNGKQHLKSTAGVKLGDQLVPISRLHLDLENYRHDPVESEARAIAKLCKTEQIVELAQDISERGSLSPLEVLGVVPLKGHPGHFISVEGNRRTCALIVTNDPDRAPESAQAQLRRIAKKSRPPDQIKVHVFATKDDAKQWIDLRHLGAQNGAGTREWDATQKARSAGGNSKTTARDNNLSVLVLDRLVARGMLSAEQRQQVAVSTITRYLGTPGVRAVLGLGSNRELVYTHDPDEVDNALLRVVLDSIESNRNGTYDVHSRTDSRDRLLYVNKLKSSGAAPSTPLDAPRAPPRPTRATSASPSATERGKRSAVHPDKRKSLIPSGFAISNRDPVLGRLRKEGLKLDVAEYSFCANYILRALLEQTMTLFAKKQGVWKQGITDQALTQACAKALVSCGVTGKAATVAQKAAGSTDTPYSLHSLGHAVHGGSIPTADSLKRHFDTWKPALEAMLARI
jgi:hypothetical protein